MRDVTIIVPCFNEGARIRTSVATLDRWFAGAAEILVVDDGSTDDTAAHVQQYGRARGHVRVHRLAANSGKGAAIRAAIPLATGARVLVIDADVAFDKASADRALDALTNADLAIGNRRHAASRYSVPVRLFGFLYRRHLVGLAFNAFVNALLQLGIRDTQCGLKAFRREVLAQLAPSLTVNGFAFDIELLLVVRALRLRLAEVPVQVTYESAQSSVRIARSAIAMASQVLRIFVRRLAGRYSPQRLRAAAAAAPVSAAP